MSSRTRPVWPVLVLVAIGASLLAACSDPSTGEIAGAEPPPTTTNEAVDAEPPPVEVVVGRSDRLGIAGENAPHGVFDPSVEYGPDGTGWLAYSAVYGDRVPFGPHVETHIARSDDHGATWTHVSIAAPSVDEAITTPDGEVIDGNWNHEVPSLVYDPLDPGREWKLFTHRTYGDPSSPELTLPQFSWITLRYTSAAETPAGGWSDEEALFGSGRIPVAPFEGVPRIDLSDLHEDLAGYAVYSEPGALMAGDTLYLTLTAITSAPEALVLLASDDHGSSWRYVSTIVDRGDAADLGFTSFDGSSLVAVGDRHYLLASPKQGDAYSGTYAIAFADLAAGELRRDADGTLAPELLIEPDPDVWDRGGRNAGQADHHEQNTGGGILFPQLDPAQLPALFGFSNSGLRLDP